MAIGQLPKKNPRYYTISVVFLVLVAIITVALFAYKAIVASQNENNLSEITELKEVIAIMRGDENIQAYELYDANKKRLNELDYLSNIPLFHASVKNIWKDYNIDFTNFAYAKGNISVSANTKSDSSDEAYEKFEKFISDFRIKKEDAKDGEEKEFLFDLEFVRSFLGYNSVTTDLSFIVKPEKKEVNTEEKVDDTTESTDKNNK